MEATKLLQQALDSLRKMTSKEVKEKSKRLGIVIPEEPKELTNNPAL